MTDVIDNVIKAEGPPTNDPIDKGGPTAYGISKAANPEAWADGKVTEEEARAIYQKKYIDGPGFNLITDSKLQAQLIDYGVNSGPMIAIQKLQHILGIQEDGVLGPKTLAALSTMLIADVRKCLVAERVKMIGKIVVKNPSQLKFLNGWLDRALQFLS